MTPFWVSFHRFALFVNLFFFNLQLHPFGKFSLNLSGIRLITPNQAIEKCTEVSSINKKKSKILILGKNVVRLEADATHL